MKLKNLQEAKYAGPQYDFETVMGPVIQWVRQRFKEESSDPSDGDLLGEIIDEVGQYIWDNIE